LSDGLVSIKFYFSLLEAVLRKCLALLFFTAHVVSAVDYS